MRFVAIALAVLGHGVVAADTAVTDGKVRVFGTKPPEKKQ